MPSPKKRATKKKGAAPAKTKPRKVAKKKAAAASSGSTWVPRSETALQKAKAARKAMLADAIRVADKFMRGEYILLSQLGDHLKSKLGGRAAASDMTANDWRNLANTVNRHFEKQGAIEAKGRRHGSKCKTHKVCHNEDAPGRYRILEGAEPLTLPLPRAGSRAYRALMSGDSTGDAKGKSKKKVKPKATAPAKRKAPTKRKASAEKELVEATPVKPAKRKASRKAASKAQPAPAPAPEEPATPAATPGPKKRATRKKQPAPAAEAQPEAPAEG
jgi:hypothetical protein